MSLAFRKWLRSLLIVVAVVSTACFLPSVSSAHPAHLAPPTHPAHRLHQNSGSAPQLQVVGNQLYDQNTGQPVVLHGVTRSGTQSGCITPTPTGDHHYQIFPDVKNGPPPAEIATMMTNWGINAVRIPLNEDCWLNTSEIPQGGVGGTKYIKAIVNYVHFLNTKGLVAILDLHYSAPAGQTAYRQESMPNADYSAAFWTSVAQMFAGNDAVVFDAFNEPAPPKNPATGTYDSTSWTCWLKGQTYAGDVSNSCASGCPDLYDEQNGSTRVFNCVGMQALVDAIRSAAPDNVIMLGGVDNAKEFNLWNQYLPQDPNTGQAYTNLAMSAHLYNGIQYDQSSLTQQIQNGYPVIAGEVGGGSVTALGYTNDDFLLPTLSYLDNPNGDQSLPAQSYLAWHWNFDNTDNMALVTDYNTFSPTTCYGQAYQAYLTGANPPTCP